MSWVRRNLLFEVRLFMFSVATHTFGFGACMFYYSFLKKKKETKNNNKKKTTPHLLSLNCPKCRTQQLQKSYLTLIIQRWKTFISPPKQRNLLTKACFIGYKCVHNLVILIKTTLSSLSVTIIAFSSLFPLLCDQHCFKKRVQLIAAVLFALCFLN